MRNLILVLSAIGALTIGMSPLTGCGDGSSGSAGSAGTGGSGVDAETACKDLVSAVCGQYNSCAPFIVQLGYGDQATCEERNTAHCLAWPDLSGSNLDAAAIETCADAYKAQSCQEFFTGAPEGCRIPGDKADGAVCAANMECKGIICDSDTEGACGTCATILTSGAACDPMKSYCDTGLYCDSATKKCASEGKEGSTCSADAPCAGAFGCNSGKCGAPLAEGVDCSMGDCDIAKGLLCNQVSNKCEKIGVAKLGGACGFDTTTGAITLCEAGAQCDASAMNPMGKCIAQPKEGDSCVVDSQSGSSDCLEGLLCVNAKCSKDYPTCQ